MFGPRAEGSLVAVDAEGRAERFDVDDGTRLGLGMEELAEPTDMCEWTDRQLPALVGSGAACVASPLARQIARIELFGNRSPGATNV